MYASPRKLRRININSLGIHKTTAISFEGKYVFFISRATLKLANEAKATLFQA